ncbi:hypothetical protein J2W91_003845 [Paenibacillus amylolyticus]|uniref:Uncharacterized protein n=1 Tax=Paenibacillus amylolyticus TaxID=1451 RepID=A0AAP5LNK2_PAEAM|nr:hypothetical protein [Paenibacillus amylolyticus]
MIPQLQSIKYMSEKQAFMHARMTFILTVLPYNQISL